MQNKKEPIIIHQLSDIHQAVKWFIPLMEKNRIFSFEGKMGAGKTTFIKNICNALGVQQSVNSPTFSIVNEYEININKNNINDKIIFHFDCYRIKNIQEALEIGTEEYLTSGQYCFIEWAENIAPLLPDDHITIKIEEIDNEKRRFSQV